MCKKQELIFIGERTFRTKDEIKVACQEILYKTKYNDEIKGQDDLFLRALIKRHPEADKKIGCGIKYFTVRANMTSRVFYLYREDGSSTDWSYLSCVTNPSRLTIVKKAARNTIRDQVIEFKHLNFKPGMICPISGKTIDTSPVAHVDHSGEWTFDKIITTFMKNNNIDPNKIELAGTEDNSIQKTWKDPILVEKLKQFHKEKAILQIVHEYANLSILDSKKNYPERFM
ncbi:MAG: DUF3223 domain-containing protein [Proteobacteria bacterium]|nr:MAG: DUF3223 domain-containing protein [Pseudomonadota bacterium]